MSSRERLAAALAGYGCVERAEQVAEEIFYVNGEWLIPLGSGEQLRVDDAALPPAVAELLALYADAVTGDADARRQTAAWLCGERAADGAALSRWLQKLGWTSVLAGAVVLIEFARTTEAAAAEEAAALLQALIEPEQAVVAREGGKRIWVLLPLEQVAEEQTSLERKRASAAREMEAEKTPALPERAQASAAGEMQAEKAPALPTQTQAMPASQNLAPQIQKRHAQMQDASAYLRIAELNPVISGWIDTLSSEMFLLSQAGVSGVHRLEELFSAREEAEFALQAGRFLPGKQAVHAYDRLGIARLLNGAPARVRQRFVAEILPPEVLAALTPELRETAAVFVENGQGVAETARALFVHRNTLLYRLERIHELTGCDPRHPLEGWTLWLALLLLKAGCTSGAE